MEKVVVIQRKYDVCSHWENGKVFVFNTQEDAIKYVKENMVKDTKQALLDDIHNGADEEVANGLIALLDAGWDSFVESEDVNKLMAQGDYDFGLGTCTYEFGYSGYDGDPWSVGYDILKAEQM